MAERRLIQGVTIEADSVVIKGADFDALCALAGENEALRGTLSLAEEGLANYEEENQRLRKLTEWQPIDTAPKGVDALFCVVPRTAGDDYFVDTSGFPIHAPPRPPRVVLGKLDCGWSSLDKAILWMPVQPVPQEAKHE